MSEDKTLKNISKIFFLVKCPLKLKKTKKTCVRLVRFNVINLTEKY